MLSHERNGMAKLTSAGYVVYIVAVSPEAAVCKIGMTRNMQRRLQALQSATPQRLTVVHTWPVDSHRAAQHLEHKVHETLAPCRLRGEWFTLSPSKVLTIWRLASERDALAAELQTLHHTLTQLMQDQGQRWQQDREKSTALLDQLRQMQQRYYSAVEQHLATYGWRGLHGEAYEG
jgi:hypothetical protein